MKLRCRRRRRGSRRPRPPPARRALRRARRARGGRRRCGPRSRGRARDEPRQQVGTELVLRRVDARAEDRRHRLPSHPADLGDRVRDHALFEPRPSRVDDGDRTGRDEGDRRAVGDEHHERHPDPGRHRGVGGGRSRGRLDDGDDIGAVHLAQPHPLGGIERCRSRRGHGACEQAAVLGDRGLVADVVAEVRRCVRDARHPAVTIRERDARAVDPQADHAATPRVSGGTRGRRTRRRRLRRHRRRRDCRRARSRCRRRRSRPSLRRRRARVT